MEAISLNDREDFLLNFEISISAIKFYFPKKTFYESEFIYRIGLETGLGAAHEKFILSIIGGSENDSYNSNIYSGIRLLSQYAQDGLLHLNEGPPYHTHEIWENYSKNLLNYQSAYRHYLEPGKEIECLSSVLAWDEQDLSQWRCAFEVRQQYYRGLMLIPLKTLHQEQAEVIFLRLIADKEDLCAHKVLKEATLSTQCQSHALILAAQNNCASTIRLIIQQENFNPHQKVGDSCSALIWASKNGYIDIVENLLLKESVDINFKDKNGHTAFEWATFKGFYLISQMIIADDRFDPHQRIGFSRTALIWAVENNYIEVAETLLSRKSIDVNLRDSDRRGALEWAIDKECYQIARMIVQNEGFDLHQTIADGRLLIVWITQKGFAEILGYILKKDGVDINAKDENGTSILMWAVQNRHTSIVQMLIENTRNKY